MNYLQLPSLTAGTFKSDVFVCVSGSDGNDLHRNGNELRDAYILYVIHHQQTNSSPAKASADAHADSSKSATIEDEFIWVHLDIFACFTQKLPGRCHQ